MRLSTREHLVMGMWIRLGPVSLSSRGRVSARLGPLGASAGGRRRRRPSGGSGKAILIVLFFIFFVLALIAWGIWLGIEAWWDWVGWPGTSIVLGMPPLMFLSPRKLRVRWAVCAWLALWITAIPLGFSSAPLGILLALSSFFWML